MVLSNKKLKQKARSTLAKSFSTNLPLHTSSPTLSLKQLLNTDNPKPRLSKREKRRDSLVSSGGFPTLSVSRIGDEAKREIIDEKIKRERKRKRDVPADQEKESGEILAKKVSAKKLRKKKDKRRKPKKADTANEGCHVQAVVEPIKISHSQENVDVSTKVYVGGIPFYSTEDDIRSFFESCGTITEVDCMKFPESGKFRGIVILTFKTEAGAKRALDLDGADMGGLFLTIQAYRGSRAVNKKTPDFNPTIVEGYHRIYVGNLSWDITEDDLKELFHDCSISCIRFGINKETEEFLGYAHIDFCNSVSLTMALKLDQQVVCGRPVKICCAIPLKKRITDATHNSNVPSQPAKTFKSGPKKRRTCYECGVAGHLSSACPEKQEQVSEKT